MEKYHGIKLKHSIEITPEMGIFIKNMIEKGKSINQDETTQN
jgi:hypothetical protein